MDFIKSIIQEESLNSLREKELEKAQNKVLTDSNLQTKKKSFVSEVNPNLIKRNDQKDTYMWFGVYDQLMRNKHIVNMLSKCQDTTLPLVNNYFIN